MRELAVQSANDTNSTEDRASLNAEVSQLISELDRISDNTTFNGRGLLNGSTANAVFHVGANADQVISMTISDADATALGVNAVGVATQSAANATITAVDTAIAAIDTMRGELGAIQNRFESTIANLSNVSENLSAARSRILDADVAQETSNMTTQNILQQAGVSVLAQANQAPQLALSLLG
jgi:flagellin